MAECFTWKYLLHPVRYCWSGRAQRQPSSSEVLSPRLQWCEGSLGVKGLDPAMPICFSSFPHQTPISFPLPQLLDVWRISCTLPAWLCARRAWEMRSYGKTSPVEPKGMWNLDSSQIKITFIWPSAPVFVGVEISEAVELTQHLHTQRLARFLPSPLVCSVSLPTPYHSYPGASNLC